MKSILVPTDGSPAAALAINIACDIASAQGARLKLLHVLLVERDPGELLRLPAADSLMAGAVSALEACHAAPAPERSVEQMMSHPEASAKTVPDDLLGLVGQGILSDGARQAAARGVDCDLLPLASGPPAEAIIGAARDQAVDAVVMGCRGLSTIEAFTLGSASQAVCRQAPCPCIMVH